ncbi:MAG TPA: twin-arginine translocation signal domain-containing protein [Nitrospiraceae bacterium]|jgi:hypothetical protein|nr:twin-arginine translocation signal domain-containing protein [Nitrospiraceae bacterium]
MDIDRRSLMKGLLAGGALMAMGAPSWALAAQPTRSAKRCMLFLGDSAVDDAFAEGVRAVCRDMGIDEPRTVKVAGGLLSYPDQLVEWLERSSGARWIAAMDDASAAVFQELARSAGGRLLSVGSHASGNDDDLPFRHTWLAASPAQGVGGLLASQLIGAGESFSITEGFLSESSAAGELTGWSAPGFSSYRSAGSEAMHLHCSGFSVSEACRALALADSEGWTSIPPHVSKRESVSRRSPHWVESVGYAVAASAFGMQSVQEACSARAFVHRTDGPGRRRGGVRFVSFVMDV